MATVYNMAVIKSGFNTLKRRTVANYNCE